MSQFSEPVAQSTFRAQPRRPLWMLTLLAIGFGPLFARMLLDEQMAALGTYLVNTLGLADDRSSIHLIRIAIRFCLPACVALAILRLSSLGQWFAFTPLTLACLLVGDAILVLNVVDQLRLYVLNGYPSFRFAGDFAAAVAMLALGLAATTLALATAWYRSDVSRQWISRLGQRWCREA